MNRLKKQRIIFLSLAMVLLLFLVACGSENDVDDTNDNEYTSAQNDKGDDNGSNHRQLIVSIAADPLSLDPQHVNETNGAISNTQIYETLITHDSDMNIVPCLATSWERIDPLTIEFRLRDDVYFHNGEHFTASDVYFTLRRAADSPTTQPILGDIDPDGLEIVDDYTIRISSFEPFAPMLANLAHTTAFIVSQAAVEYYGENFRENPIGTGPFMFSEWNVGDNLVLVRNDKYWDELPEIGGITFKFIPEQSNRIIALETGEADIAMWINPGDVAHVQNSEDLTLVNRTNFTIQYLGFNNSLDMFQDKRVRQAFNYAVDVELIVDTILEGWAQPSRGPMGTNIPGASNDIEGYEFNPERARDLLAAAGFEDGFDVTISLINDQTQRSIVEAVANQLGQVGINVTIEPLESGVFAEFTNEGNHEIAFFSWTTVTGDADYALFPLLHSEQHGSAGNRSFFANPEVDNLLESARVTFDEDERRQYYAKLQQLIRDEAPWLFLTVGESLIATRVEVEGYEFRLNGQQTMRHVRFVD
jgi:peptide/nickel transport system substrate-binding protein